MDGLPRLPHEREVVRPAGLEREVVPVRRPLVVARLADERPGDHAADPCLPVRISRATRAGLVELLERDRLLVRRDLEDRVARRVDDPLARSLMLLAELLDDLRSRGGLVAEDAAARLVHERVDHVVRETLRVGRKRGIGDDSHQLPVAGGRVLALRPLEQPSCDRGSARAAAGSRPAARRSRGRAPPCSEGRARSRRAPRFRACPSPRHRRRRHPEALPRPRRPARSRKRAARGYSRAVMDAVLGLLGLIVLRRLRDRIRGRDAPGPWCKISPAGGKKT